MNKNTYIYKSPSSRNKSDCVWTQIGELFFWGTPFVFGCINFYLIFLQKPFVTLKIIKTTWFLNETPRKVIEVLTKTLQVYPYIAFFNVSSQVAEKNKSTNKNKKTCRNAKVFCIHNSIRISFISSIFFHAYLLLQEWDIPLLGKSTKQH